MFTEEELQVKAFIEEAFVPTIHEMMAEGNAMHYIRYGGRCCKQVAYLLALYLNKALPDYNWTAWESMFDDGEYSEEETLYSHAWTFGRHKEDKNRCIIMDYGKLENEYSFFLLTTRNRYPKELENFYGEGDHMELDFEDEDYREELKPTGLEAFTQKSFPELLIELERELNIKYKEDF